MTTPLTRRSLEFIAIRERIYAYLMALVRDPQVAEDLLQELYVSMATTIESGDTIETLQPWCLGVARNLALRHWRNQRTSRLAPEIALVNLIDRAFEESDNAPGKIEQLKAALSHCRSALSD